MLFSYFLNSIITSNYPNFIVGFVSNKFWTFPLYVSWYTLLYCIDYKLIKYLLTLYFNAKWKQLEKYVNSQSSEWKQSADAVSMAIGPVLYMIYILLKFSPFLIGPLYVLVRSTIGTLSLF